MVLPQRIQMYAEEDDHCLEQQRRLKLLIYVTFCNIIFLTSLIIPLQFVQLNNNNWTFNLDFPRPLTLFQSLSRPLILDLDIPLPVQIANIRRRLHIKIYTYFHMFSIIYLIRYKYNLPCFLLKMRLYNIGNLKYSAHDRQSEEFGLNVGSRMHFL